MPLRPDERFAARNQDHPRIPIAAHIRLRYGDGAHVVRPCRPPSRIRSHRPHDITGSYRSSGQVRTGPDKGKLREKTRSQQTLPQYPALRSPVSHLLPTCDRSEPNAPRTVIRAVGPATRPPQRPTQASGEQSDRLALRRSDRASAPRKKQINECPRIAGPHTRPKNGRIGTDSAACASGPAA